MEKLGFIKLLKKISRIMLTNDERRYVTAKVFYRIAPDLILINVNGVFAKTQAWWEENFVIAVTHEDIHVILYELCGVKISLMLDNLWANTWQSRFLVDGNTKWFKWKDFK